MASVLLEETLGAMYRSVICKLTVQENLDFGVCVFLRTVLSFLLNPLYLKKIQFRLVPNIISLMSSSCKKLFDASNIFSYMIHGIIQKCRLIPLLLISNFFFIPTYSMELNLS
jgi:hypothetical protein